MSEHADARILGARDGLMTALIAVRREISAIVDRRSRTPARYVRRIARTDETLALLRRLERQFDEARTECDEAYRARQAVEIVSPHRHST